MFSKKEEELLKFIKKKPITIAELVKKVYGNEPPFEARKIIADRINRIVAKLDYSKPEGFDEFIIMTEGGGRGGKSVWREDI